SSTSRFRPESPLFPYTTLFRSVIAIVSSHQRERAAFAALCESRAWPCTECDSVRSLKRLLLQTAPKVVLTRHRVVDGYSDDIIADRKSTRLTPVTVRSRMPSSA